jgi:sugar lactone lactonase YvrE
VINAVDAVTAPCTYHGEGAVWASWAPGQPPALKFVDMLAGDVLTLRLDGTVERDRVGTVAAALRPRASGGFVVAIERGFLLVDGAGFRKQMDQLWTDAEVRMNDGGCDPDGRFYCGSMGTSDAGRASPAAGRVYRLDPDGTVTTVLDGLTIPNGFGFSPDGGTLYHVDTPTQHIYAYDYDRTRGLTNRRVVVAVPERHGHPDGPTVDGDGNLWVAMYGGGAVRNYTPAGRAGDVIAVPVSKVTSCAFGGPELDQLYITSASIGLDDEALAMQPNAGGLFMLTPGVKGSPQVPFAG